MACGADALLARVQADFDAGHYRWVVQVTHHLVFADPSNRAARELAADARTEIGAGLRNAGAHWRKALAAIQEQETWGRLELPVTGWVFIRMGETPKRLRVNGTAAVSHDDPLIAEIPGAVFVIRLTAERIFPNCPRYIHKMQLVEESVYAPRPDYSPPVPAWKTFEVFRDALPPRDRAPAPDKSQE